MADTESQNETLREAVEMYEAELRDIQKKLKESMFKTNPIECRVNINESIRDTIQAVEDMKSWEES